MVRVALERDVLTGGYEGGFKVWECAIDLVQYLTLRDIGQQWKDAVVIEAGCGVGLPAIYALQMGASAVYFQDLNREVLERSTKAAVALNARTKEEMERWCGGGGGGGGSKGEDGVARFVAGDWDLWHECHHAEQGGVDVILSTDTLYATPQIEKLARLLHRLLRRRTVEACAYVAAKRYYFGTDGGTYAFERVLSQLEDVADCDDESGVRRLVLRAKVVHSIVDSASNIRDVLLVTWCERELHDMEESGK